MKSFPNCKINIGLNVVSKRPDGYHNIESVFYPIPFCDKLEINPAAEFSFLQKGIPLECDSEKNLCVKAFRLLKEDFPKMGNVHICLTKNIPSGAGLGGGSSDAAFTLKMLNSIFNLNISTPELEGYAVRLGADCPVFIENRPRFASGLGNVFSETAVHLQGYRLLLVKPDVGVSTAEAYSGVTPRTPAFDLRNIDRLPVSEWGNFAVNDFEKSIFEKLPVLAGIKEQIKTAGALYSAMSGSGSTIYGIFGHDSNPEILIREFGERHFTKILDL